MESSHRNLGVRGSRDESVQASQLEEALTRGPDPLHLAALFGLNERTAIRYANAARQLLATPIENSDDGETTS